MVDRDAEEPNFELYDFENHPPWEHDSIADRYSGDLCPICGKAFEVNQKAYDRWGNQVTVGEVVYDPDHRASDPSFRLYCPGCWKVKSQEIRATLSEGHATLDTFEEAETGPCESPGCTRDPEHSVAGERLCGPCAVARRRVIE